MKVKLSCYYGEHNPGDVIDVDDEEGIRLIEVANGAVAVSEDEAAAKAAADEAAAKAAAENQAPAKSGKGK